jgi:endoglucanase
MKPNFNAGGQMNHFVNDDGFSVFRLPMGWQWLINDEATATGVLDTGNIATYVVRGCQNQSKIIKS